MTTRFHLCVSVDIDRFSDRALMRDWAAAFTRLDGSNDAITADDIRGACREMREQGFAVFPAPECDNRKPNGMCAGHEVADG